MVTTIGAGGLATGGAVVETSGGVKYAIFRPAAGGIAIYKNVDLAASQSSYYFDCSDGGPTDPSAVWTDDANAFDGLTNTYAYTEDVGAFDYLGGEGTNGPASGDDIHKVDARIFAYDSAVGAKWAQLLIRTDGWAESLLSQGITLTGSPAWSDYYKLSEPSGGWTWAKVQALEVRFYRGAGSAGNYLYVAKVEIRVTARTPADSDAAATIFGGGAIGWVHAAIDGGSPELIHIVCACSSLQTRDVAYATFNTGTDTLGAWEEAAGYTNIAPTNPRCHITLKSDGTPWVLYGDNIKISGGATDQVYANYKTGGAWQTPEQVNGVVTKYYHYDARAITACPGNDLEAFYYYRYLGDPALKRRNASWGAETLYTEPYAAVEALTCTTGDVVYRYHRSGADDPPVNLEENNVDTGYDTRPVVIGFGPVVSAALDGTDRYVFYRDAGDDIHLISNTGTGWTDEGALQVGTYYRVIAEWAYNFENQSGEINYIFDDGTDVFYDSFSLAPPVTVPRHPATIFQNPAIV